LVVFAEATEEFGVGEDDAPLLTDGRDVGERGWLRSKAAEDLLEEILEVQQWR
jgi:hypothetical protein